MKVLVVAILATQMRDEVPVRGNELHHRRLAVPTRPAQLLVELLHRAGRLEEIDSADVREIDAQAKGHGGHHDVLTVVGKDAMRSVPPALLQLSVVEPHLLKR